MFSANSPSASVHGVCALWQAVSDLQGHRCVRHTCPPGAGGLGGDGCRNRRLRVSASGAIESMHPGQGRQGPRWGVRESFSEKVVLAADMESGPHSEAVHCSLCEDLLIPSSVRRHGAGPAHLPCSPAGSGPRPWQLTVFLLEMLFSPGAQANPRTSYRLRPLSPLVKFP